MRQGRIIGLDGQQGKAPEEDPGASRIRFFLNRLKEAGKEDRTHRPGGRGKHLKTQVVIVTTGDRQFVEQKGADLAPWLVVKLWRGHGQNGRHVEIGIAGLVKGLLMSLFVEAKTAVQPPSDQSLRFRKRPAGLARECPLRYGFRSFQGKCDDSMSTAPTPLVKSILLMHSTLRQTNVAVGCGQIQMPGRKFRCRRLCWPEGLRLRADLDADGGAPQAAVLG